MHSAFSKLAAVAFAFALTAGVSRAQLNLSGETIGSFNDLHEANTTVTNASDGSWATFATGVPVAGSFQSKIAFQNAHFSNVQSGDPVQVGVFTITNGMTAIGSGAPTAQFNIGLRLTSPIHEDTSAVSTVSFHIDHTVNRIDGGIPDTFSVSFNQPEPVMINGTRVQFHVKLDPQDFQIAENATMRQGEITVTFGSPSFTPVPEPSTYAACGAAMLVGLAAFRRFRGARASKATAVAAIAP